MRTPKETPGVTRLRALNAGPRLTTARAVVRQIVATPMLPLRKPKRPVAEQAPLF